MEGNKIQTFLPYADFEFSAKCLDSRRLNNQRNEAKTILYVMADKYKDTPWTNHPATRMWRGYERALIDYIRAMNDECNLRSIKAAVWAGVQTDFADYFELPIIKPTWIGIEAFHASHRSNLLRKDKIWYGQMRWAEPPDLPYYWPV